MLMISKIAGTHVTHGTQQGTHVTHGTQQRPTLPTSPNKGAHNHQLIGQHAHTHQPPRGQHFNPKGEHDQPSTSPKNPRRMEGSFSSRPGLAMPMWAKDGANCCDRSWIDHTCFWTSPRCRGNHVLP